MAELWWNVGGLVFAVMVVFALLLAWASHKDRWPR